MIDISISIETKKTDELSRKEMKLMNLYREREFGKSELKDFKRDYPDSLFFFLKQGDTILAFGTLVPLGITYLGKDYKILGICNIVSTEKGRGYGRMLVYDMIKYLDKEEKTGLGFCPHNVSEFYNNCGFNMDKNLVGRFKFQGELPEERKNESDLIYHEGPDNFIDKVSSTEDIVSVNMSPW